MSAGTADFRPFYPVFYNPHLATIAASFWPRQLEESEFPVRQWLLRTEPEVQVLIHSQAPPDPPRAEVVLVHGLEGSSNAGYMRSMAQALLEAGFAVHRFNIRACGGAEFLCRTLYHAGLTHDLLQLFFELDRLRRTPVFLVGFSLGGNMVLKLAGELGKGAPRLLQGVCAVSTPIDLLASARRIGQPANRHYEWWFLRSMKQRMRRRRRILDGNISLEGLERTSSLYDFDDRFTAPSFRFRNAEHYYTTQSALTFLAGIEVPTLLLQAKDDPLIPFSCFEDPGVRANRRVQLVATERGGHLGFLSRPLPRFWVDGVAKRFFLRCLGNK